MFDPQVAVTSTCIRHAIDKTNLNLTEEQEMYLVQEFLCEFLLRRYETTNRCLMCGHEEEEHQRSRDFKSIIDRMKECIESIRNPNKTRRESYELFLKTRTLLGKDHNIIEDYVNEVERLKGGYRI